MTKLEELRLDAYERACQGVMLRDGCGLEAAETKVRNEELFLGKPVQVDDTGKGLFILEWNQSSRLFSWSDDPKELRNADRIDRPRIKVRSGIYGERTHLIWFLILGTDLDLIWMFGRYASLRLLENTSIDSDTMGVWLNEWLAEGMKEKEKNNG